MGQAGSIPSSLHSLKAHLVHMMEHINERINQVCQINFPVIQLLTDKQDCIAFFAVERSRYPNRGCRPPIRIPFSHGWYSLLMQSQRHYPNTLSPVRPPGTIGVSINVSISGKAKCRYILTLVSHPHH